MDELATMLQQVEDLEGTAKRTLEVFTGRPIDVGDATILDVSTFIDSLGEGAREDKTRARMLGLAMGALYGKCIAPALGGEWFFDEASHQAAIRLRNATAYPFTHVAKHVAAGASETILAKYAVLKLHVVAGE